MKHIAWLMVWTMIASAFLAWPLWKLLYRLNPRFRRFCHGLLLILEPLEDKEGKIRVTVERER